MNLPFKLPFGKQEKKTYFLALLLHDEKANAVVFEEVSGKIQIIGRHKEYFKESIEVISVDELLEVVDKTIAEAENSLPDNIQTQKTIFGLKEGWVEEGKIRKDYLLKLKKISEALDLAPIGFLIIHEAITNLIQQEEGIPISAIFVEAEIKGIAVSALRAGKVLETKRAEIQNSVAETLDKLLHELETFEVFPSRIILLSDKDSEKLSQDFTNHSWSKNLPFLHVPRITVLPKEFEAKAVIFGAAKEMGFEILNETPLKEPIRKENSEQVALKQKDEEPELIGKENKEDMIKETKQENSQEYEETFGFIKDVDIASMQSKNTIDTNEEEKEVESEELIKALEKSDDLSGLEKGQEDNTQEINDQPSLILKMPGIIKNFLKGISFPKFSLPKGNRFIFIPPFIIGVLIIFLLLYIFTIKATVTLYLKPRIIEKEQTMLFSTKTQDKEGGLIPITAISVSEEGTTTVAATGKKEVGDKAKGTVTIYNSDLRNGKNITKGSTITSPNDLEFTLDSSVSLSSASGDASSISPSTQKVSVTAAKIGKEHNLPSSTKFSIEGIDTSVVIAKNESAFSGGTKKEINVVVKADIDKASEDLISKLEPNAKNNIAKKLSDDYSLFPFITDSSLGEKEINKDVGEEASTLTLTSTVNFRGASYKKSDLEDFSKNLLDDDINDFNALTSINYDLKDPIQDKSGDISATLLIKASLLPKIDNQRIVQTIAGKKFEDAEKILMKLPQAEDVRISLNPGIPFLPKILPRIPKNIDLLVLNNG